MKVGGYKVERVKRFDSLGATFVRKGDALLVAREAEGGEYELELIQLEGFKSIRRKGVERVTSVSRVGEKACMLKARPPRRAGVAGARPRLFEVRALKDFRVLTTIVEDEPGHTAAHPSGTQLAIAHDFGPLHVWDSAAGKLLWKYESKGVGGVAYSGDGTLLAAKEFAGALKVFDAGDADGKPLRSVAVGREPQIAFHPTQHVVAAAASNSVKLVDADAGKVTATIKVTKKESRGAIRHMSFSPDGKLLVTSTQSDHTVGLWDVEEAEFVGHLVESEEPLNHVEFDASGEYLLVSSYEAAEIYTVAPA